MPAEPTSSSNVLAGRYRLSQVLARGGMGTVYEGEDLAGGEPIAIKRLHHDLRDNQRVRVLFELEYHTLARLSHPRIIQVFDSGVDSGLPFYTMELLQGRDLKELAPIDWRVACSYLRDVASSLALLHTRRLLHRDLSPRNVRQVSDGHCKLLDFGAMCRFGTPEVTAGTPPFVPPEALQRTPLDQRSDLYSLGALAYYLLTRTYAYHARRLEELPACWLTPPPRPSSVVRGIPEELDSLVMSLMDMDRTRRPGSAAEVIETLQSVADLDRLDETQVVRGYFLNTPLIGREGVVARLQRRLQRLDEGRGSVTLLRGPSGAGASRILDEMSLKAQTSGIIPVRVDAGADRGPGLLARSLARTLNTVAPSEANSCLGAQAGDILPLVKSEGNTLRLSIETGVELPGDARARLIRALTDWILRVAAARPLLLMVDRVDLSDEFSLSLLGALAHQARRHRILLLFGRHTEHDAVQGSGMEAINTAARTETLLPLNADQVGALTRALFGETRALLVLSDFLHRHSGGNPGLCLELARHLVAAEALRYVDGIWVLARQDLGAQGLPSSLSETLRLRMEAMAPDARALAETAAVNSGAVPIDRWLQATGLPEPKFFGGLDALIQEGVVVVSGEGYDFTHEAMRQTFLDATDPGRMRELHLRFARVLGSDPQAEDPLIQLAVGWHSIHGGHTMQGARLLAQVAPVLARELTAMDAAIPALETSLRILEDNDAERLLVLRVRAALARASYQFDAELERRYGLETLRLYHQELCLHWGDRLRALLGATASVFLALGCSVVRNALRPKRRKGPSVVTGLIHYNSALVSIIGVRGTSLDVAGMAELRPFVESVRGFVGRHAGRMAYLLQRALLLQPLGREVEQGRALRLGLEFGRGTVNYLHPADRRDMQTGMLTSLGMKQVFLGGERALEVVSQLQSQGSHVGDAAALRVRQFHHLFRCEWSQADDARRELEAHGIRGGATWQVLWFALPLEALILLRAQNLVGCRRNLEQLRAVVRVRPSLEPLADLLDASLLYERGELEQARTAVATLLPLFQPCERVAWSAVWALAANIECATGDFQRGFELASRAWDARESGAEEYAHFYGALERARIWSMAGIGRADEARTLADDLARRWLALRSPLSMFEAHQARCQVAQISGDAELFQDALREMVRYGQLARSPGLLMLTERQARSGPGALPSPPQPAPAGSMKPASEPLDPVTEAATAIRTHGLGATVAVSLAQCGNSRERAHEALRVLAERTGSTRAFLFLSQAADSGPASALGDEEPPDAVEQQAMSTLAAPAAAAVAVTRCGDFELHLLELGSGSGRQLVGVFAYQATGDGVATPGKVVMEAVATALAEPFR